MNRGNKSEHRLAGADRDFLIFRANGTGAMTVVLHHAKDGDLHSELLRHLFRRRHLSRTAVNQPQVGQRFKAVLFAVPGSFTVMGQPTGKHLLHRSAIVRHRLLPYRKFFVQPFFGASAAEYRHAAHNGRTADVGNVKRLDIIRRAGKSQQPSQFGQCRYLLAGAVGIARQLLCGVILRHLAQLTAFAPLRHRKPDLFPSVLPQQLLQQQAVGQFPVKEHLGGRRLCLHIVAQQEFRHHFLRLAHAVKGKVLFIPQASLPQHQQQTVDLVLALHPAQHV